MERFDAMPFRAMRAFCAVVAEEIDRALVPIRNRLDKMDRRLRHIEARERPRLIAHGDYTIPREDLMRMASMLEAAEGQLNEFTLAEDFPYSPIIIRRELEWLNAEMSVAI